MFAYRSHNPAPQQNPCTSWSGLIEGYLAELAAAGRPPSTRRLRADQLRHLARGLGLAPHQVTRNTLLGWFAAQRWATETRRGYRGAARGFFGWAHRTGALAVDPAAELPAIRARQGVPRPGSRAVFRWPTAGRRTTPAGYCGSPVGGPARARGPDA